MKWIFMNSENNLINIPKLQVYKYQQPIDASWVRLIYIALKKHNLPAEKIFKSAGITTNNLRELESLDRELILKLYENIAQHDALDALPITILEIFQPHFLRYTGTIISDAKSVNDLINKLVFAFSKLSELMKVEVKIGSQFSQLVFSSRSNALSLQRVTLEISICLAIKIVTQMFPLIKGGIVNIILNEQSRRPTFENAFNCPVIYSDKVEYSIVFKSDLLNSTNIFSTHMVHLDLLMNENSSKNELKMFSDIERLIIENIATNDLSIIFIANKMNVSVKTLQRHLQRFNTNFSTLSQSYKMKYAMSLLRENKLTLTQITYELGFNSPSSFSRAFKKWTGFSPSHYQ